MNFDEYLSAIRDKVSSNTFKLLNDFRINVGGQFVLLDHIIEEFISLSDGGKYIRGCLVKLGYEMYLNEQIENEDILNAASAFEIFHTAVLIHDDVIDKGKKREDCQHFIYRYLKK